MSRCPFVYESATRSCNRITATSKHHVLRNDVFVRERARSSAVSRYARTSSDVCPTHPRRVSIICPICLFKFATLMTAQREKIQDNLRMIEKWETLASRVEQTQANALHCELAAMKTELKTIYDRFFSYEIVLERSSVLDDHINEINAELAVLKDRETAMLALNVSAHRLITDLGVSAPLICTALKDGVADLYRIWDETFQKGTQQLCVLQAVQQFGMRMAELQSALQRDKDTLAVLDVALQAGVTSEVASSVRHVARLLSERQDINCQNDAVLNDATTEEVHCGKFIGNPASNLTQEGGSLSDSGISDSGSDQELSERERRLAALRRLTRSLETQLAPDSEALTDLWKKIEHAETELRDLQKQCRDLIVRTHTAASVGVRAAKRTASQIHYSADKRKKAVCGADTPSNDAKLVPTTKSDTKRDNPDDEPNSQGWARLRRAAKVTLSFCFAMTVLFVTVYLWSPQCCEAANTQRFTLSVSYPRGPPPL